MPIPAPFPADLPQETPLSGTITACPLCGSPDAKTACDYGPGRVLRCLSCSMQYHVPYKSSLEDKCGECRNKCMDGEKCLDAGYAVKFLESRLRLEVKRLERIKDVCSSDLPGLRVLEIGAGIGALSSLFVKHGAVYRGVEPAPLFYRQLLANFPELGGKVGGSLTTDACLPENSFDLITAVDVLECVPQPVQFLSAAKRLLAKNGRIYIEVPNEALFRLRTRIRGLFGLYPGSPIHPGHINFFSPRTLKAALEKAGLEVTSCFQVTLAGDRTRMEMTLKRKLSFAALSFCGLLKLSRADLLLQQGNLVAVCGERA